MERVMGIEPTPPAWKAGALPLSYTRDIYTHSLWWREQDLNLRTHTRADLQSAAFDRSAIPPLNKIFKLDLFTINCNICNLKTLFHLK
jgi:hypothetical protein